MAELATYLTCDDCHNRYGTHDFHDCLGKFDELRYEYNKVLPNSAWIRVKKKYGLKKDDPILLEKMSEYLKNLSRRERRKLDKEYEDKLASQELALYSLDAHIWELEELLWQN